MNILVLKKIRDILGVSREEMAKKLDISITTLNNWEYRTKRIPRSKINSVKFAFNNYFKDQIIKEKQDIHLIIGKGLHLYFDNKNDLKKYVESL